MARDGPRKCFRLFTSVEKDFIDLIEHFLIVHKQVEQVDAITESELFDLDTIFSHFCQFFQSFLKLWPLSLQTLLGAFDALQIGGDFSFQATPDHILSNLADTIIEQVL